MIEVLLLCAILFIIRTRANNSQSENYPDWPQSRLNQFRNKSLLDESINVFTPKQTHESLMLPSKRKLVNCYVKNVEGLTDDSGLLDGVMSIHDGIMDDERITVPAYAFIQYDKRRISKTVGSNNYDAIFTQNPTSCP